MLDTLSRTTRITATFVAGAALCVAAFALTAPPAEACGGFFCSQVPMDQAGERIVFGVDEGRITANIQITFDGDADDFAWVVPVSGVPDIELAPEYLFQQIDQQTRPNYWLNWDFGDDSCGIWPPMADGAGGGGGGDPSDNGGVEVLAHEQVGPYDTVVVSSQNAMELLEWLNDNGFDQPDEALPIIDHYILQGMVFLGMKLTQDAGEGDIQPVRLEFDSLHPCIPLVLTRIAAQPEMPVYAWVMGDERAVVTNWFEVEVNEKKVDWLTNGSNFVDAAIEAINEADGQAFVTDFAGELQMPGWFWKEGQYDTDKLAAIHDPMQFLSEMLNQGFPRDSQLQALIKKWIPKPAEEDLPEGCKSDQEFYTWNAEVCFGEMPEGWTFDPVGFAADLAEKVVAPLKSTQEMVDANPYTTRLFTAVSPHEMTKDPMFDFNPDLPDVSNYHSATAVGECSEDSETLDSVTITLENGESFVIEGPIDMWGWGWGGGEGDSGWADPAPDEAAAESIVVNGTSGPPETVDPEDVEDVNAAMNAEDPTYLGIGEEPDGGDTGDDTSDTGDTVDDTSDTSDTGDTGDDTPVDETGGDDTPVDETGGDDTIDDLDPDTGAGTSDGDPVDTSDGSPDVVPDGSGDEGMDGGGSGDDGCSGSGGGTPALPWIVLAGLLLAAMRRRGAVLSA